MAFGYWWSMFSDSLTHNCSSPFDSKHLFTLTHRPSHREEDPDQRPQFVPNPIDQPSFALRVRLPILPSKLTYQLLDLVRGGRIVDCTICCLPIEKTDSRPMDESPPSPSTPQIHHLLPGTMKGKRKRKNKAMRGLNSNHCSSQGEREIKTN
jgi:hypothetical protein